MGLFGPKYVTQVGTSVSRVIEDRMLPNSAMTGITNALFNNEDVSDSIMNEMTQGVPVRVNRMYNYAKSRYVHGLPSGKRVSSNKGKDEVRSVLRRIYGSTVSTDYINFGTPNTMHIAWMRIAELYNYDPATNQLGSITAQKGTPVYLKDMVVVFPDATISQLQSAALVQWGTSPQSGYTPQRPANTVTMGNLLTATKPELDATVTEEYVRVTYVWEESTTVGAVTTKVLKEGSVRVSVAGYDHAKDYFHVKLIASGITHYWMYEIGSGTYPELDTVFSTANIEEGTYFPFAYFRYEKKSTATDKTTTAYKSSKKLVKYLGISFDNVAEAIDKNPDIKDVEQAMMVMAIPANTTNPMEQRYLFDFFDELYEEEEVKYNTAVQAWIAAKLAGGAVKTSAIVIQDKLFKLSLSNGGIYKRIVPGSIGPIGSYDSEHYYNLTSSDFRTALFKTLVGVSVAGTKDNSSVDIIAHYYRRQITETLYEEIQVVDLKMRYHIFGDYTATGGEKDEILLVPIDKSITDDYSIPDRELLLSRSMHFVFNSKVVTKLKWYQTGIFKVVIWVIAIVLTIVDLGTDSGAWISAAAALTTITNIIINLIINLIIGQILSAALSLVVKLFGKKVGYALAVFAIIYGGYQMFQNGSFVIPNGEFLLQIVNGLFNASIAQDFEDLLADANEFSLFMKEQTKLLDEKKSLLNENTWLSPQIVMGESPDDFYTRTIHSGNIGVFGIDAVTNYVAVSLTLPELKETLGGNTNDRTS